MRLNHLLLLAIASCHGLAAGQEPSAGSNWERLTMLALRDNQGNLVAETPYPSGWQINANPGPNEAFIRGPGGVKVMNQPGQSFVYTDDPRMQQIYSQSGQRVRAWPGAERLVQEDFVPALVSQGWRFLKGYEVPEVTKIDKWYNDQLYRAVPMQIQVMAIGTEWEKDDGSLAFMITHVQVSNSATMQMWSHFSGVLKADREHFEKAKKQFIF
ncbi:MAG TPA: hypothetical protein VD994_17855, partial [Prosthecobacter sp.]|nr:hypothetical protein [Prosthecobacter sp.]